MPLKVKGLVEFMQNPRIDGHLEAKVAETALPAMGLVFC
jgi:hypothetical protein